MSFVPRLAAGRQWARAALVSVLLLAAAAARAEGPRDWVAEFPETDFAMKMIAHAEIRFHGARRDTIRPIDEPRLWPAREVKGIGRWEPVFSVEIAGDARAYPVRVLLWHETVNDMVGGVPVVVTFSPLSASGAVFERTVMGDRLTFGNTGRIRNFDSLLYDRQTESWWQQFTGEAVMGAMAGTRLRAVPARLESFKRFLARQPEGQVLVPADAKGRPYGITPYVNMDSAGQGNGPNRYPYGLPAGVHPLDRIAVVDDEAWTLDLLRREKRVEAGDLVLTWEPGQNSAHDAKWIAFGRDVGNVVVRRKTKAGALVDAAYRVAFAFAFAAFSPDGALHH